MSEKQIASGDRQEESRKEGLLEKLLEYGKSDYYPFHMPGHKRQIRLGITSFPNPFSVDITEIDGFDNLHHAEEILKDAMDKASWIYGSDRSYFMVNGSTGGILSAVCGLTRPGGRILMARNCHKSVYHAVMLQKLEPLYVYPEKISGWGIQGGIRAEAVEEILGRERKTGGKKDRKENKENIQAVFITSPTYEGIVSDIEKIAEVCHRYGVPLIVDEAHGAHFPFGSAFPKPALECGADVVIQSLHKTLPSLTQTAILHVKSRLADPKRVERYLPVFQTSSPSYVFLASIENCISYMDGEGRREMDAYAGRLLNFMKRAQKLRMLRVLDDLDCGLSDGEARDLSKLVISPGRSALLGTDLAAQLRERFYLEPEMVCRSHVILMTSLLDTEEGLERLWNAVWAMDEAEVQKTDKIAGNRAFLEMGQDSDRIVRPCCLRSLSDAWNAGKRELPLEEAAGRISGGFITVYPPGIPMLVPGEQITGEMIDSITENRTLGLTVEGISEDGKIEVIEE